MRRGIALARPAGALGPTAVSPLAPPGSVMASPISRTPKPGVRMVKPSPKVLANRAAVGTSPTYDI